MNDYTVRGLDVILKYLFKGLWIVIKFIFRWVVCLPIALGIGNILILLNILYSPILILRLIGGDPNITSDTMFENIGQIPYKILYWESSNKIKAKDLGFNIILASVTLMITLAAYFAMINHIEQLKINQEIARKIKIEETMRKAQQIQLEKEQKEKEFKDRHPFTHKTIEWSKDLIEYVRD